MNQSDMKEAIRMIAADRGISVDALLQVLVTYVGPLQRLFDTTSIDLGHWLIATAVASSVVWVEELRKAVARRREAA